MDVALLSIDWSLLALSLQVAVKTSLDVYYFTVPFDLHVALDPSGAIDKDVFRQKWQAMGDAKQISLMATAAQPPSSDAVVKRLKEYNCFLVAQRPADTFVRIFGMYMHEGRDGWMDMFVKE